MTDEPDLARDFSCLSVLSEAAGDLAGAGWASLKAAWACDDEEKRDAARLARSRAIKIFERAREASISFAADKATEQLIIADLLRRSGRFAEANGMCARVEKAGPEGIILDVLQTERMLVAAADDQAHKIVTEEHPKSPSRLDEPDQDIVEISPEPWICGSCGLRNVGERKACRSCGSTSRREDTARATSEKRLCNGCFDWQLLMSNGLCWRCDEAERERSRIVRICSFLFGATLDYAVITTRGDDRRWHAKVDWEEHRHIGGFASTELDALRLLGDSLAERCVDWTDWEVFEPTSDKSPDAG